MQISEFIQNEILLPRVKRNGVLVVYDPEHRYQLLCKGLKSDGLEIVDTGAVVVKEDVAFSKLLFL